MTAALKLTDGGWDTYAVCTCCNAKHRAAFANLFFAPDTCPRCGEPKGNWPIKTLRWVTTAKLFHPSTWGTGYWQDRAEYRAPHNPGDSDGGGA